MNRWAILIIGIIMLSSTSHAQKKGSQEMGGGISFWSITEGDSSQSNLNVNGLWAAYFSRDFMFELEPHVTLRFATETMVLNGLVTAGLTKRIIDVSNHDRRSTTAWNRKHEKTTAGIYGSLSGGFWAERSQDFDDEKIYLGPAVALGIGTHSALGSLTKVRTKFQIVYLMPTSPLYDQERTMFTMTIGFGVITKL